MFRILYAESDATFYEHDKKVNTGLDEVLEIRKDKGFSQINFN